MMKKFMKKLWDKKDSKKGFTLVELIVVLVILGILMAILIPTLTAWIDKAKNQQVALNARTVLIAAQSAQSEAYGKNPAESTDQTAIENYYDTNQIKGTWVVTIAKDLRTIKKFEYHEGSVLITYEDGAWAEPQKSTTDLTTAVTTES